MLTKVIGAFVGILVTLGAVYIGPKVGGEMVFYAVVIFLTLGIVCTATRQRFNKPWTIRKGLTADKVPFVTKRRKLLAPEQRLSYPHMVSVGWAYDIEGSGRLPTDAELERITACESTLTAIVSSFGAIIIGSITSDGFHQFLIYGDDPAQLHLRLIDSLLPAKEDPSRAEIWELGTTYDPIWNTAQQL